MISCEINILVTFLHVQQILAPGFVYYSYKLPKLLRDENFERIQGGSIKPLLRLGSRFLHIGVLLQNDSNRTIHYFTLPVFG